MEAGDLAPTARLGPLGLLDDLPSQGLEDGVACQTREITALGLLLDPLPHLGGGKGTIAAKDQQGVGPGCAKTLAHALQHRAPLCPCETLGLEDGRQQASREALIQVERHTTRPAIIAIVTGVFLLAMDRGLRVIDIEHDDLGGLS